MASFHPVIRRVPLTRVKILLARVLYRLVVPFLGRGPRRIVRGGIRFEVDLSEGTDFALFCFGAFQRHVARNALFQLAEDATVFDIGANFGIMALGYARQVSRGHVYAFEPTDYAMRRFATNLGLNPELRQRIHPVHAFVTSTESTAPVPEAYSSWRVDGRAPSSAHPVHLGIAHSTESAETVTVDSFCRKQRISRLDLIKIDTDGHEFEVMKGAANTLRDLRPRIIFECGLYLLAERGLQYETLDQFLARAGYRVVEARTGRDVTTGNHSRYIPELGTVDLLAIPRA